MGTAPDEGPGGDHLAPLLAIADEALSAADLVRHQHLTTLPVSMPAAAAAARLADLGYQVAPLTEVPIARYVRGVELSGDGPLSDHAHAIDDDQTLPETTPLSVVLDALRRQPFLFVRHRHHVTGIVTRADLEQPVVGLLVLGLVLSVESALDRLVTRRAGDDGWLGLLSEDRAERVRETFRERRRVDADLAPVRCLNLDDRLTLARKLDLHTPLGFTAKQHLKSWAGRVGRVRDHLAHGDTLLSAVPDPSEALETVAQLREVAERAWRAVDDEAPRP
jgi:hypothetical protein